MRKRKETTEKETLLEKLNDFRFNLRSLTFYQRLELSLLVTQIVIAVIPLLMVVIPIAIDFVK